MAAISLVRAIQQFFTNPDDGYGRKVEISEFKLLTDQDKADLAAMLRAEGVEIEPQAEGRW